MLIPVNFDIWKFYTFKFRRQTYNELYWLFLAAYFVDNIIVH